MNTPPVNGFTDTEAQFAAAAEARIRLGFAILAMAGVAVILIVWRWPVAAGFALGAIVSFVSMAHLQHVVQVFTARAAGEGSAEPAAATVMRFLMRFALITVLAYAVFRISRAALYGYVTALFLPVAAMSSEAAYEAWFAVSGKRRSS
jgi:hypothetical protein